MKSTSCFYFCLYGVYLLKPLSVTNHSVDSPTAAASHVDNNCSAHVVRGSRTAAVICNWKGLKKMLFLFRCFFLCTKWNNNLCRLAIIGKKGLRSRDQKTGSHWMIFSLQKHWLDYFTRKRKYFYYYWIKLGSQYFWLDHEPRSDRGLKNCLVIVHFPRLLK